MQEIELKFLVPQSSLKGLMRQVKGNSSQSIMMSAHYYDTSDRELAKSGIGLRIRQEGEVWVQTIKAGGDGLAARTEHNATLDKDTVQRMLNNDNLMPDLDLYKGSFIEPMLADFDLEILATMLQRQYITEVQRLTCLWIEDSIKDEQSSESTGNNSIEIAYDYGRIIDGSDNTKHCAIQEIEFELVSGELAFLFSAAKSFCKRYKLRLSTVTKAERGGLLIKDESYSPAVGSNLKQLPTDQDIDRAALIRAIIHNCLLQILPNSSAIIAGSQQSEHLVQLSIGIHRLSSALKAFTKFSDQLNTDWLPLLEQTTTLLDNYRKLNALVTAVEPSLQQQGAPAIDWMTQVKKIKITPINAIAANDFQLTLLELIAFSMGGISVTEKGAKTDKPAQDKLPKILSKQCKKVLKGERRIEKLERLLADDADADDLYFESQIKLLKQIQALRYLSEFAMPFYAKKKAKRWLKRLIKLQQSLEKSIDNNHYRKYYQQQSIIESNALYGAGWFAAKSADHHQRYQKRIAKFKAAKRFW